jgi:hypothetical protein
MHYIDGIDSWAFSTNKKKEKKKCFWFSIFFTIVAVQFSDDCS